MVWLKMSTVLILWTAFVAANGLPPERNIEPRIIGGHVVYPHSIPYQALLVMKMGKNSSLCGGSLISPSWILTAAHCFKNPDDMTVVLGAHNLAKNETTTREIKFTAKDIIFHPGSLKTGRTDDIALIKLPSPVPLSAYIQTVQLPNQQHIYYHETFTGDLAALSGWGQIKNNIASTSVQLRQVSVRIASNQECRLYYPSLSSKQICTAGVALKGGCEGDTGGPVTVTRRGGPTIQVGVISFAPGKTCEKRHPTVSTRLTSYIDWIKEVTGLDLN